ncbi:MAG: uroporphyrinogen-III synthase [Bryobacterales bacterium]|nr:uroporphyrinogen-III synthase [Bryobacterales bacterium]
MATLIRNQGGVPFVAASLRDVAVEEIEGVLRFAQRLFSGEFDMVVLLTGVGTRALEKMIATRYPEGEFAAALRRVTVVARGPKPSAALREMGLTADILAPEPNTWKELLAATEGRTGRRVAVQEYGRPSPELVAGFEARGAEVTTVRVYQYRLPEDTGPMRRAARGLAAGEFDVAMFTTAMQGPHLLQIAGEEGVGAEVADQLRRRVVVASIGPVCSDVLEECGIGTDFAPSHPKMGILVRETAERARALVEGKRGGR